MTLPSGVHQVYDFWKANLKPGGFGFAARIINYPGGQPGDVGLFFSWPKSAGGQTRETQTATQTTARATARPYRAGKWRFEGLIFSLREGSGQVFPPTCSPLGNA